MELYWVVLGFAAVVLLLIVLLARLVGNAKRREIRRKLGLPPSARLTPAEAEAFRTYENTDMRLKQSFPTLSDTQRQAMARDVVRDKGMLPRPKRAPAPARDTPAASKGPDAVKPVPPRKTG